jgi:hypothetical protein
MHGEGRNESSNKLHIIFPVQLLILVIKHVPNRQIIGINQIQKEQKTEIQLLISESKTDANK